MFASVLFALPVLVLVPSGILTHLLRLFFLQVKPFIKNLELCSDPERYTPLWWIRALLEARNNGHVVPVRACCFCMCICIVHLYPTFYRAFECTSVLYTHGLTGIFVVVDHSAHRAGNIRHAWRSL